MRGPVPSGSSLAGSHPEAMRRSRRARWVSPAGAPPDAGCRGMRGRRDERRRRGKSWPLRLVERERGVGRRPGIGSRCGPCEAERDAAVNAMTRHQKRLYPASVCASAWTAPMSRGRIQLARRAGIRRIAGIFPRQDAVFPPDELRQPCHTGGHCAGGRARSGNPSGQGSARDRPSDVATVIRSVPAATNGAVSGG